MDGTLANLNSRVKRPDGFADIGAAQHLQVVAVSADGKPVTAPAKLTVSRHDWN